MPTQKFAIERNGPKRLEISWSGMWKDFAVKFDGAAVGSATKDELNAGKELKLSDGSTFKVHLRKVGMSTELSLTRDGVPLPGSGGDPVTLTKTAAGIVYFIGGLNVLLGVVAMAGSVQLLLQLGFGIGSIIVGVLFGVLGFFTMQRSRIALGIAMAIYALDGIATLAMGVAAGGQPGVGGIIMHVLFLTAMWRGFKAMGELKTQASQAPSITSG